MERTAPLLLIVDPDEEFGAQVAAEAQGAGFRISCCRSWWEVKDILDGPEPVAGMIVELLLPQGTPHGLSVALMARSRRTKLPIVVTTADGALLAEVRGGVARPVSKDVGPAKLVAVAAQLIDSADGATRPLAARSPQQVMDPLARYRLDRERRFRHANDTVLILWRKQRPDLLGRAITDIFPQIADTPKFEAHLSVMRSQRPIRAVLDSAILHQKIEIAILPYRGGVSASFSLAA